MSSLINISYDGNLGCRARLESSGSEIATDAPIDDGGKGEAFSPTDLLAAAVGTCVMTVMGIIAKNSKIDLAGAQMTLAKEMTTKPPRRIGKLTMTITIQKGKILSDAQKNKLEKTVEACPVKQSLHPEVVVESRFVYQ